MDNGKTVFCCYAFRQQYIKQQTRLRNSIREVYPRANLLFYTTNPPPYSRPFLSSLYGFKPHLAKAALEQGFSKVILLDPAMILKREIDLFLQYPVVAVKDTSVLWNVTSDKTYQHYNLSKEEVKQKDWHLVGGSFYYFDFENPIALKVYRQWLEAEELGLFGSQYEAASEQLQGHRYDETLMSFAMYMNGITPQDPDQVGYCIDPSKSIWLKEHFK